MNIPVFELKRQFQQIKGEIFNCVKEVLLSGRYILDKNVLALEKELASYCGVKYAVGVASGTDALTIALRACGIKAADQVITTPFTFLATAEAINNVGAKIVFADIDLNSYDIDPVEIEKKITRKTRAIVCVHLYGQPCNMQALTKISRRYKLQLIEDCAQAAGAEYRGKKVGSFGDAGCFSFYPTKNLGGYGDGGMILTNRKKVAELARMLRFHGSSGKYEHLIHGYNSRLDELQAAILRIKLKYLGKWNNSRRSNAAYYNRKLANLEQAGFIVRPKQSKNAKHVYHLYVLRLKRRDALMQHLRKNGVACAYHYPIPLHLQRVYRELKYLRSDFPQAECAAQQIVTLPLFPELQKSEIDSIIHCIEQFFKQEKR